MAELCASVGVSMETPHRHSGSKNGLVQAVPEARSDHVVPWLREAAAVMRVLRSDGPVTAPDRPTARQVPVARG
ncbi:hypothetical protein GCM10020216_106390 [Nonomuraea helvata]